MTRNERRKLARVKAATLKEAVAQAEQAEAAKIAKREAWEQFLADTPDRNTGRTHFSKGVREVSGRVIAGKVVRKDAYVPPLERKPIPEGMTFHEAAREGLVGQKRKRWIG